jgi:hypothetical protein
MQPIYRYGERLDHDNVLQSRLMAASKTGWAHMDGRLLLSQAIPFFLVQPGPVDGPFDISHSTQSELGGLTAPLLLVTSSLAKFWGLNHKCRYRWITPDSKAAISKVTFITGPQYSPWRYPDNIDYITAITELH